MVSDGRSTPHPRRARLARHLRLLREDSNLTIETVGRRLGWSGSKLSRIETRVTGVTPADTARLLDVYGIVGPRRESLTALARAGDWRTTPDSYPDLEAEAAAVLSFESMLVPGIMQIPEYVRSIVRSTRPGATLAAMEGLVAERLARQALLTREDGPRFWLVVDESALLRQVGGPRVMRAQLARLMDFAELPSVTLQVFPVASETLPAPYGAFTVLQFRDGLDPGVVALEHQLAMFYLEEPSDVDECADVFRRLTSQALDQNASVRLLAQLIAG
ncbi:helix-turn-helix transcriptional regulator [Longispora sp. K20-0274]|uniref:helix-turn-helix domain-containing protein n=1 Tax=Longispora sp. K20-0274 TaxID=3088255 RepID=UPI00399AB615